MISPGTPSKTRLGVLFLVFLLKFRNSLRDYFRIAPGDPSGIAPKVLSRLTPWSFFGIPLGSTTRNSSETPSGSSTIFFRDFRRRSFWNFFSGTWVIPEKKNSFHDSSSSSGNPAEFSQISHRELFQRLFKKFFQGFLLRFVLRFLQSLCQFCFLGIPEGAFREKSTMKLNKKTEIIIGGVLFLPQEIGEKNSSRYSYRNLSGTQRWIPHKIFGKTP